MNLHRLSFCGTSFLHPLINAWILAIVLLNLCFQMHALYTVCAKMKATLGSNSEV